MRAIWKAFTVLVICICMPAYAGMRVLIDRGGYAGPLEIRIGVPQEDAEPQWIQAQRLASESAVDLAPLAAGTYVVLLSGDHPLERFAIRTGVRGEGEEVIRIAVPQAQPLRGAIRVGAKSAGDAVLNFESVDFGWSSTFSAREDGTFETPVWQPGSYILIARGGVLASAVRRPVRIEGPDLAVDLSPLRIAGIVTDADGVPIPEARVALRSEFGREKTTIRVQSDAHGTFEFADVKAGPYSIAVLADGYLITADHRVYVTGEMPVEKTAITMNAGVPRPLRIVDAGGKPVANALVHVIGDGQLRSTMTSGAEGRVTVAIPPSGSSAAWVIPINGSFAVIRLEAGQTAPETTVVIPDGSASVTVDVLTPDRSGVAGLGLLMRYNGEILLPSAFSIRTDEKGRARFTRMPPGLYELWPYFTAEEAAELIAAQSFEPGPAPIRIEAAAGESRATVVVEKQESRRGAVH